MAVIYRDLNIKCSFGTVTPTVIVGTNKVNVMTENDMTRILITFPTNFINANYIFSMDIAYTTASMITATESYDLTYDNVLAKHYFLLDRKFTYNEHIKLQFRARLESQAFVDPMILDLYFKKALKSGDLSEIDANPEDSFTITLQEMVDAHAAKIGDIHSPGHIQVDGVTTLVSPEGILTLMPANGTVIQHPDGSSYAFTVGTLTVSSVYTELCRLELFEGETFKLSYIGVSATQDAWFHLRLGTEIISAEMIASGGMYNQFMFPYGFITATAMVTSDLILEAKTIIINGILTGEFAGEIGE